ncbi:MAG TPA: hypothetical protein VF532_15255 [Candidatus Angelobacter sp.]
MKKILTFAFALLLAASLSVAQTGGTTDKKSDDKKPATADTKKPAADNTKKSTKKGGKKGEKSGKKSTPDSGTTAPK